MKFKLLACVVWVILCGSAVAHELAGSRATLVLRDQRHLSGVLYFNVVDALHLTLAPQRRLPEFLLQYSAMKLPEFQKELARAQGTWQREVQLALPSRQPLALSNWVWPQAAQVHALVQQRMMQATVAPAEHGHEQPVEVKFEALAQNDITGVTSRSPAAFQKVWVVSYQPRQVFVPTDTTSPLITF